MEKEREENRTLGGRVGCRVVLFRVFHVEFSLFLSACLVVNPLDRLRNLVDSGLS